MKCPFLNYSSDWWTNWLGCSTHRLAGTPGWSQCWGSFRGSNENCSDSNEVAETVEGHRQLRGCSEALGRNWFSKGIPFSISLVFQSFSLLFAQHLRGNPNICIFSYYSISLISNKKLDTLLLRHFVVNVWIKTWLNNWSHGKITPVPWNAFFKYSNEILFISFVEIMFGGGLSEGSVVEDGVRMNTPKQSQFSSWPVDIVKWDVNYLA